MLLDWRFVRVFVIAVTLHSVWNSPIQLPFFGKYVIVGLIGWVVVLGLIGEGLEQLEDEQKEKTPPRNLATGSFSGRNDQD